MLLALHDRADEMFIFYCSYTNKVYIQVMGRLMVTKSMDDPSAAMISLLFVCICGGIAWTVSSFAPHDILDSEVLLTSDGLGFRSGRSER